MGSFSNVPLILRTNNTERVRIDTSGNLGIGATPDSRFLVNGAAAVGDKIVHLTHSGVADVAIFYETDTYAPNAAAAALKIGSLSSTGRSINAGGTINASGADYAEYFYQETPGSLKQEDMVCLTPGGKVEACTFGEAPIGIVSTKPGFVGNDLYDPAHPENTALVGIMGQIPLRVNMEGGAIAVGDPITTSSVAGEGSKATGSARIIGTALESATAPGTIKVFVKSEYAFAPSQLAIDPTTGNIGVGTGASSASVPQGSTAKLAISGNVLATSYETVLTPATSFTLGTTSVTAQIPSTVLTAGNNVDLYKLATYNLSGISALASAIEAAETRLTALEARVAALESGAITSASGTDTFSTTSLAAALESFGAYVKSGLAQFGTLVADRFVAASDSSGTSSAGTVTILAGNTVAQINNAYVAPSTKVFVTMNSPVTGNWYVSEKKQGSFRVVLAEVQSEDVSFDYFLVQTEGQIATATSTESGPSVELFNDSSSANGADTGTTTITDVSTTTMQTSSTTTSTSTATSTPPSGGTATTTPSTSGADTAAPVVTLTGDAAIELTVGDTFTDPGATATDETDGDLTADITVSGTVDTATEGLYTLTYSATDAAGNTGTASRAITVTAPAPDQAPTETDSASTTPTI